jgi:hypothetical protein
MRQVVELGRPVRDPLDRHAIEDGKDDDGGPFLCRLLPAVRHEEIVLAMNSRDGRKGPRRIIKEFSSCFASALVTQTVSNRGTWSVLDLEA